jgi:hypothetical protein
MAHAYPLEPVLGVLLAGPERLALLLAGAALVVLARRRAAEPDYTSASADPVPDGRDVTRARR